MCCVCTVTVEMNNFAVFTFTFTFVCHPGKTHNLRSRGDTSRRAQTCVVNWADNTGYSAERVSKRYMLHHVHLNVHPRPSDTHIRTDIRTVKCYGPDGPPRTRATDLLISVRLAHTLHPAGGLKWRVISVWADRHARPPGIGAAALGLPPCRRRPFRPRSRAA